MKGLRLPARLYVVGIAAVGLILLLLAVREARFAQPWWFLVLLIGSSAVSRYKIHLPLASRGATMSVSHCVDFASLVLLGPHEAMLIAGVSAGTQCLCNVREQTQVHRTLFSVATLVITVQVAGQVASWLGGFQGAITAYQFSKPLVGAATAFFLCNTAIVAIAIALTTGQSVMRVWNENFLWSAPGYFIGAGAAALAVLTVESGQSWLTPLVMAPVFLTFRSYQVYLARIADQQCHLKEVSELHFASVEALARAIDARDLTVDLDRTHAEDSHFQRVQAYAVGLARAVGMTEHEIQGVKIAALLHDVGKLAVPEHILTKPGRLTHDEFEKVRKHPRIGAGIIKAVPFPYPVASLIESHHERWDGTGYPDGLKGDAIPLGARILAVVDYFDALMSDRSYHRAMSEEEAVAVISGEAGTGLDPVTVSKFVQLLPELNRELSSWRRPDRPGTLDTNPEVGKPATGFESESPAAETPVSVFHDIALASREMHALYEIAEAMGTRLTVPDTMALIASKVGTLVPASCWALFLLDETDQTVRCHYAAGLDAEIMRQVSVRNGDGVTGWVMRSRSSAVNARPAADIEAAGLSSVTTNLKSALACPLLVEGKPIGVLAAYHVDAERYRDDHRRLLERISGQASAVIRNATMFEKAREDSLTDSLTGLPNSRSFVDYMQREIARARRHESHCAMLVLDLDNFKEINDRWGHRVGDRALQHIADVLSCVIRRYDLCARYAGDEFIIAFSQCDHEAAASRCADLQEEIRRHQFEPAPGVTWHLNVSIGVAVYPDDGASFESLLEKADRRMYRNKNAARRSLIDAFEPVAAPTVHFVHNGSRVERAGVQPVH